MMRLEIYYPYLKDRAYVMRKVENEKQVIQMAKEMLKDEITDYKVLLKLTRIFLSAKYSDESHSAKKCLDKIQEIAPNNATYLHYSAMLYQETGDFKV